MATQSSLEDFDLEEFQQIVLLEVKRIYLRDEMCQQLELDEGYWHLGQFQETWGMKRRMKPIKKADSRDHPVSSSSKSPSNLREIVKARRPIKFFLFAGMILWIIAIKVIFPNASTLQTIFLIGLGGPLVYWVAPKKESHSLRSDTQERSQGIIASGPSPQIPYASPAQVVTEQDPKIKEDEAKLRLKQLLDPEVSANLEEAEEIVKRPSIKKLICPAILSMTSDALEYSKVLTPILVGAVLAKTIVLPLDSLLFAAIAVVVAKGGASTICAGYVPEKK